MAASKDKSLIPFAALRVLCGFAVNKRIIQNDPHTTHHRSRSHRRPAAR